MKQFTGFILALCCIGCMGTHLQAQYNNGQAPQNGKRKVTQQVDKGDLHLRWYPLGLINIFDQNLTLEAEYSYVSNRSMILDAGYVMASTYGNESGKIKTASGFIIKTAHRWYFGKGYNPSFIDAEAGFKSVRYQSEDQWVGRGVVAGTPAYEELMQVESQKDVFTLGARIGKRVTFSPTSRVGMEFWGGLGIRYRHYYPKLPQDAETPQDMGWFSNPMDYGENWFPDFQLGLRLTVSIGAKNKG